MNHFHQARWNQKVTLQTTAHCAVLLSFNTMQPPYSSNWIFSWLIMHLFCIQMSSHYIKTIYTLYIYIYTLYIYIIQCVYLFIYFQVLHVRSNFSLLTTELKAGSDISFRLNLLKGPPLKTCLTLPQIKFLKLHLLIFPFLLNL